MTDGVFIPMADRLLNRSRRARIDRFVHEISLIRSGESLKIFKEPFWSGFRSRGANPERAPGESWIGWRSIPEITMQIPRTRGSEASC